MVAVAFLPKSTDWGMPHSLQIFVRSLSGATFTVNDLDTTDDVAACYAKVAHKQGIASGEFRLVFQGKQLDVSRQLGEYSVEHGTTSYARHQFRRIMLVWVASYPLVAIF